MGTKAVDELRITECERNVQRRCIEVVERSKVEDFLPRHKSPQSPVPSKGRRLIQPPYGRLYSAPLLNINITCTISKFSLLNRQVAYVTYASTSPRTVECKARTCGISMHIKVFSAIYPF